MKLVLNAIYTTIQGEGPYLGTPALFIRTFGCNLQCDFVKGGCDSAYTWDPAVVKKTDRHVMSIEEALEKISQVPQPPNHWVITGGEPLLQQKALTRLITSYAQNHPQPFIEWETNGTIIPAPATEQLSHHYNVSLKLSNSSGQRGFNTEQRRLNPAAIRYFSQQDKTVFKFVVDQPATLAEVKELQQTYSLNTSKIWLMSEGATRRDLNRSQRWLQELAVRHGYHFTPRWHIMLYGNRKMT